VTRHHQVWHFHSNRSSAVLSKALNTFKYLLGKKKKKKERKGGKKKKAKQPPPQQQKNTALPHALDSS